MWHFAHSPHKLQRFFDCKDSLKVRLAGSLSAVRTSHGKWCCGYRGAEKTSLKARTAASGPRGWFHTPPATARKSAPAATSGWQLATVMPPMATQGTSIRPLHHSTIPRSAGVVTVLVVDGKKAPNAT